MTDDDRKKLRLAIHRRTRAWVEVYRHEPDGPALIRSLLLGVQAGLGRRTGQMTYEEWSRIPHDAIQRAWSEGRHIAEQIPASLIRPFERAAKAA